MTAFPEDFLQTIVNVNWGSSLEMAFQFQLGGWPGAAAIASGGLSLTLPATSAGNTSFSSVLPKTRFLVAPGGGCAMLWSPTVPGPIPVPDCVIHAYLGTKLVVDPIAGITGATIYAVAASDEFNPAQVPSPGPRYSTNILTVNFDKKTLSWQYPHP
jgi:hypothetical protein